MKLCLLPLDSRPCTYRFPAQIASICGGCEVIRPPLEQMDRFKTPSDPAVLEKWLEENTASADYLILSVEQLLYGGLVASRTGTAELAELLPRLDRLRLLKSRNPRLKIYASNVIMRATVSTLSRESQRWWEQIARYSHLSYLAQTAPPELGDRAREDVEHLAREIPAPVLGEFLAVRRRNHAVNLRCLELCWEGVFDKLVFLQEDCAPESLQLLEQRELLAERARRGLEEKVWLHNGTDEAGMELTALAAAGEQRRRAALLWLGENRDFTAKYEDRPFMENLRSHLSLMGMEVRDTAPDCLVILPPHGAQGDYCPVLETPDPYTPDQYRQMAGTLERLIRQGKRCWLLDLSCANGGDLFLFRALGPFGGASLLSGYAGWNTAGNSLGTILAQLTVFQAPSSCRVQNRIFTWERLLDDLFYQALARPALTRRLEAMGEDIWCLSDPTGAQDLLEQTIGEQRDFPVSLFGASPPSFSIELPWPRIFEALISIKEDSLYEEDL